MNLRIKRKLIARENFQEYGNTHSFLRPHSSPVQTVKTRALIQEFFQLHQLQPSPSPAKTKQRRHNISSLALRDRVFFLTKSYGWKSFLSSLSSSMDLSPTATHVGINGLQTFKDSNYSYKNPRLWSAGLISRVQRKIYVHSVRDFNE